MAHYIAKVIDDRRLELPQGALKLARPGQEIEIDLEDTGTQRPLASYLSMSTALDRIAEMSKDMPYTDSSETLSLIRDARAGGMYADASGE
jgi:hypothetical protein